MKTRISIGDDTRQRLRYFMYYGRGQFAHGRDARYVGQLGLRVTERLLRALPLLHLAPQLLIGSHQFTGALHDAPLQIVVKPQDLRLGLLELRCLYHLPLFIAARESELMGPRDVQDLGGGAAWQRISAECQHGGVDDGVIDLFLVFTECFPVALIQPRRIGAQAQARVSAIECAIHLLLPAPGDFFQVEIIASHVPFASANDLNVSLLKMVLEAWNRMFQAIADFLFGQRIGYRPDA